MPEEKEAERQSVVTESRAVLEGLRVVEAGQGRVVAFCGKLLATLGADVLKLVRGGVPVMHLEVDREKYFWFHHTDADTIDKLDPVEFNHCVAAMAVMAYVIADLPETLPR